MRLLPTITDLTQMRGLLAGNARALAGASEEVGKNVPTVAASIREIATERAHQGTDRQGEPTGGS